VEIRVLFNSQVAASRDYVLGYLRAQFFSSRKISGDDGVQQINATAERQNRMGNATFTVQLEPLGIPGEMLEPCKQQQGGDSVECQELALHECIANNVANATERSWQHLCLMNSMASASNGSESTARQLVVDAWEKECVVQEGGSDAKVVENIR
jgi:hypothetical protein